MIGVLQKLMQSLSKKTIDKNISEKDQFRSQSINLICIILLLLSISAVIVNVLREESFRVLSSSMFVLAFTIPMIFNFYGNRLLARSSLLFGAFLVILMHSVLYGGGMDLEFILLLSPIAVLLLTDNKALYKVCFIISLILFVTIKLLPTFYEPIYPKAEAIHIQIIVGLGILSLITFILNRFKKDTIIAQKKTELALTDLQKANDALAISEARYRAVFDNAFDGILLVNLENRKVVSCNDKITKFLGVSEEEIKQAGILDYLRDEGILDLEKNIAQAILTGNSRDKIRLKSKHGKDIFAEVSGVILPDSDNKLAVAIFKDISAEMLAQDKLVKANMELRNFAHAASHDMKEPLRMIQSFGQLLKKRNSNNLSPESEEFLGYIINASQRMTQLVNDLLEYSTTGIDKIENKETDLNNILTMVKNNLRLKIHETNTTIISENLPSVWGNTTQMSQIFQNIISNAIKFQTPNKQPQISISASFLNDKNLICIKDNGIGIAPEYHDQVFGVFKRLHSKDDYEGSGIGLATCQKIIEKLGGKIWVESELGQGTSFFFTLPILEKKVEQIKPQIDKNLKTTTISEFVGVH